MGVEKSPGHLTSKPPSIIRSFYNISFNLDFSTEDYESSNGQCWHHLFRNPVVVKGYPIPRRSAPNLGLEISLDTMAGLARTKCINTFNNKIFIKGFATMLVPTQFSGGLLIWHLLYNKSGERISYLDSQGTHAESISLSDLEGSRHILGWCQNVRYCAGKNPNLKRCDTRANFSLGAFDASYEIDRSWLSGPHDNCRLKDIFVSQGKLIKTDQTAAYGKRDKPPHVARDPYKARLFWISRKYVVLWDVECKRGWLVNGTSALLHLLRASLEFNKTDDLKFHFLFKPERFNEATSPYTITSAMEVLMNPANLNLELYAESGQDESTPTKGHFRLRDRVDLLHSILEKIIDYQIEIAGRNGEGFKSIARRDLEGWDFKDIATNEDPIYPRAVKLKAAGKGWVDFTRAIQAITLFGRGFGDIIHPVTTSGLCNYWNTLPSDKHYLAASMADLSRIMDRFGHPRGSPPRLTESIVCPLKMASNICRCIEEGSKGSTEHSNIAQVILPSYMSQRLPKSGSFPLGDSGAVVFGHNKDFGWFWKDIGDPENREQPLLDESDSEVEDSGIGSSVATSTRSGRYELQGSLGAAPTPEALTHEHYTIGVVCALQKELMGVRALFDDIHPNLPLDDNDNNCYALGRMDNQNVAAACLPYDDYGTNSAAKVASDMSRSFRAVRWYLVVGIGGGVPSANRDIRLGDVVVSTGVIQYDIGKAVQNDSNFKMTGIIQRPAALLMAAISEITSDPHLTQNPLGGYIGDIINLRPEYKYPGEEYDRLFEADSMHGDQETCNGCNGPQVSRKPRAPDTAVHYGLIASGNQVIKDAKLRDRIGHDMSVLCFEMEAAGVMKTGQCLVIRGICDYADSHKNDLWQEYAAAAAAAYAKFFISRMRNSDIFWQPPSSFENRRVIRLQTPFSDNNAPLPVRTTQVPSRRSQMTQGDNHGTDPTGTKTVLIDALRSLLLAFIVSLLLVGSEYFHLI